MRRPERRYGCREGEQALVGAFCHFAGGLKARDREAPLFWFLISKGHRTYRYLSLFAHRYYPNPAVPTPLPIKARIITREEIY